MNIKITLKILIFYSTKKNKELLSVKEHFLDSLIDTNLRNLTCKTPEGLKIDNLSMLYNKTLIFKSINTEVITKQKTISGSNFLPK